MEGKTFSKDIIIMIRDFRDFIDYLVDLRYVQLIAAVLVLVGWLLM